MANDRIRVVCDTCKCHVTLAKYCPKHTLLHVHIPRVVDDFIVYHIYRCQGREMQDDWGSGFHLEADSISPTRTNFGPIRGFRQYLVLPPH